MEPMTRFSPHFTSPTERVLIINLNNPLQTFLHFDFDVNMCDWRASESQFYYSFDVPTFDLQRDRQTKYFA